MRSDFFVLRGGGGGGGLGEGFFHGSWQSGYEMEYGRCETRLASLSGWSLLVVVVVVVVAVVVGGGDIVVVGVLLVFVSLFL